MMSLVGQVYRVMLVTLTASQLLSGCASPRDVTQKLGAQSQASPSVRTSSIGQFVMAGPVSDGSDNFAIRWRYGLQLSVDPSSISEVKFSCDPIPGSTFSAKGPELRIHENKSIFANGPTVLISRETTPWLYQNNTTSAICKAVISRDGLADVVEQAPLNFSASHKAATLQQFTMAYEFNEKLKK